MPISIQNGIVDERWTLNYDGEQVELEVKKPNFPHSLFTKNQKGFKNRHPWEIFFRILNELVWFYDITVQDLNGGHVAERRWERRALSRKHSGRQHREGP